MKGEANWNGSCCCGLKSAVGDIIPAGAFTVKTGTFLRLAILKAGILILAFPTVWVGANVGVGGSVGEGATITVGVCIGASVSVGAVDNVGAFSCVAVGSCVDVSAGVGMAVSPCCSSGVCTDPVLTDGTTES